MVLVISCFQFIYFNVYPNFKFCDNVVPDRSFPVLTDPAFVQLRDLVLKIVQRLGKFLQNVYTETFVTTICSSHHKRLVLEISEILARSVSMQLHVCSKAITKTELPRAYGFAKAMHLTVINWNGNLSCLHTCRPINVKNIVIKTVSVRSGDMTRVRHVDIRQELYNKTSFSRHLRAETAPAKYFPIF